jgi:hypothetical protein
VKAGPPSGVPIVSAFMPLVDTPGVEIDDLLSKYLDLFEYKDFPSQNKQFAIIREALKNPNEPSGQHTMAPFQIVPRAQPAKVFIEWNRKRRKLYKHRLGLKLPTLTWICSYILGRPHEPLNT